jgi:hypothetical protein
VWHASQCQCDSVTRIVKVAVSPGERPGTQIMARDSDTSTQASCPSHRHGSRRRRRRPAAAAGRQRPPEWARLRELRVSECQRPLARRRAAGRSRVYEGVTPPRLEAGRGRARRRRHGKAREAQITDSKPERPRPPSPSQGPAGHGGGPGRGLRPSPGQPGLSGPRPSAIIPGPAWSLRGTGPAPRRPTPGPQP